jgi:hypothetical protein
VEILDIRGLANSIFRRILILPVQYVGMEKFRLNSVLLTLTLGCITYLFAWNTVYGQVDESVVKAQWINDLIPYMKWKGKRDSALTICTVGREPVHIHLKDIIQKDEQEAKSKGEPLSPLYVVRKNANDPDNFSECNVLYISASEQKANIDDMLKKVKGKQILTISNLTDFAENGGIVGFVIKNGGVKIHINEKSAAESNIIIDSDLLGFAKTFYK